MYHLHVLVVQTDFCKHILKIKLRGTVCVPKTGAPSDDVQSHHKIEFYFVNKIIKENPLRVSNELLIFLSFKKQFVALAVDSLVSKHFLGSLNFVSLQHTKICLIYVLKNSDFW